MNIHIPGWVVVCPLVFMLGAMVGSLVSLLVMRLKVAPDQAQRWRDRFFIATVTALLGWAVAVTLFILPKVIE
jgi:hypothetical protein